MIVCDDIWLQKITGVPLPDPNRDLTIVSIEPYTGKVLQVSKGLQANAYIPNGFEYSMYHPSKWRYTLHNFDKISRKMLCIRSSGHLNAH